LPGAIYYSFYGQISGWLISIFGSTGGLAQVGALSRLVVVLNVLSSLFGILIIPRFARLAENKNLLFKRFFQIQGFLFILSICILYLVSVFSSQLLFILGSQYASFNTEIIIITGSSLIAMVMGITYNISVSRGWILPPVILISGNIIVQVILIYLMDLSKTINVLWFSVINNAVAFGMIFIYYIYRASKIPVTVSN
jgi:O-antigen/teichoic acid export membrane protein